MTERAAIILVGFATGIALGIGILGVVARSAYCRRQAQEGHDAMRKRWDDGHS